MSERSKIIKGIAEALWRHANGWSWRTPYTVDVPDAAHKAAVALTDLYENMNFEKLQTMMVKFNDVMAKEDDSTYPAHSFGALLAGVALRRSRQAVIEELFEVPRFAIELESNELTWRGSDDDDLDNTLFRGGKKRNPDSWDRDSAKGYGRYAYRMGRNATQAVADARKEGVPEHLMSAVADGWGSERRDTIHGGFADNPKPTKPKDYTVYETSALRGKESHTFEETAHVKSLPEVRQLLARRTKSCSRGCQGWDVFDTNRGFEIQVCDECNSLQVPAVRLSDDDVAQLPEAQQKLREVVAANMEENPSSLDAFPRVPPPTKDATNATVNYVGRSRVWAWIDDRTPPGKVMVKQPGYLPYDVEPERVTLDVQQNPPQFSAGEIVTVLEPGKPRWVGEIISVVDFDPSNVQYDIQRRGTRSMERVAAAHVRSGAQRPPGVPNGRRSR